MDKKALREVYEVIDHMSVEDTKKISKGFLERLYQNIDWSYDFTYDEAKSLEEQDISEDAKVVLAIIYMRYFASQEEKLELIKEIKKN
ncbi:MAG: hypothetical protein IJ867_01060 [Clostridia bacterium]|nr:hypothetical protein [Clostridia bacterium]